MTRYRVGVARQGFEEKMDLANTYPVDTTVTLNEIALESLDQPTLEMLVEAAAVSFLVKEGNVEYCRACGSLLDNLTGRATIFEQELNGEIVGWEVDFH